MTVSRFIDMSQVLQELEKSRQIIRKKYQKLKRLRGLTKQQVNRDLAPLITPLQHLAGLNFKQEEEEDGEFNEKREFKQSDESRSPEQAETEFSGELDNSDFNTFVENSGDLGGITSTPKTKSNASRPPVSLREQVLKRRSNNNTLGARYMREFLGAADNDVAYGPHMNSDLTGYVLGKLPFKVDEKNDKIHVGDRIFPATAGLYELIFKSKPQNVDAEDEKMYSQIMQLTGLHLNSLGVVKANRGEKYKKYIKVLKNSSERPNETVFHDADETFTGGQLESHYHRGPKNFLYWDDPNELVERLELLVGERDAGHSGVDNEIISILEELKEKGIIISSRDSRLFPAF